MIHRGRGAVSVVPWAASVAMSLAAFVALRGDVPYVLLTVVFATVGAVIAWRRPGNLIGRLLQLFGLWFALSEFTSGYALVGLRLAPGSLPAAATAAWLHSWLIGSIFGLIPSLFVLFPDGRASSGRWRMVLWAQWSLVVFLTIVAAFFTEPLLTGGGYHNPYLIVALPQLGQLAYFLMLAIVAGAISLVLRTRRARGAEREQLKWVGYAVALFLVTGLTNVARNGLVASGLLPPSDLVRDALAAAWFAGFIAVPLAIGVAILRYRLYDIDLLINRTLVYGTLSAALAATYFGAVALLQAALRPLAGQSELAVAGSTLLVVALFAPLRRRIQGTVDRRFYRSRYDAARTLDAFTVRLRDEVDLDSVRADLLEVVHDTVRPAHASVWLRQE